MQARRDQLLGETPALNVGLDDQGERAVIGDQAGVRLMAADHQHAGGGAAIERFDDEGRNGQPAGGVHRNRPLPLNG